MPLAVFVANDGVSGPELWTTDGTTAGTKLVKDIMPGLYGSQIAKMTLSGDYAYFTAVDAVGIALWRTDGTSTGTIRLAALTTTEPSLFDYNGALYFSNGPGRNVLWKSDGSVAGTVSVIDTQSGTINLVGGTDAGVMFTSFGILWRSGGTAETTLKLAPVTGLTVSPTLGGAMIYSASTSDRGIELWRSDGTSAGTSLLRDIVPGAGSSQPRNFVSFDGLVYFVAGVGSNVALWRTDGTTAGTVSVREIAGITDLKSDGTKLFLAVQGELSSGNLWVSDGSTAGTTFVQNVPSAITKMTVSSGIAYFQSYVSITPSSLVELWRSDGTAAGTFVTRDILPGPTTSNPQNLTPFDGGLIFSADDGVNGNEVWSSKGTQATTNLVANINVMPDQSPSQYANLTQLLEFSSGGGMPQILFAGTQQVEPVRGVWRSDGQTTTELAKFKDGILGLTEFGGKAFFFDDNALKTVGATGGLSTVATFNDTPNSAINYQGQLYFIARVGGTNSLYRFDGTAAGTVIVKSGVSSSLADFEIAGGKLFFRAGDTLGGHEVWVSDGTAAGTFMTKDIVVATNIYGDALPSELTALNGVVYFAANSVINSRGYDRELWRTDGTENGTYRVKDIWSGYQTGSDFYLGNSDPKELVVLSNALLFTANDGVNGRELWRSDGTEAGTVMVRNIRPDVTDAGPSKLVVAGGKLFFMANDGAGERLWVSDGTAAGTSQVSSLGAGVQNLTRVGNLALFTYDNGVAGRELWVSDGTVAGTRMLVELAPGTASIQTDGFSVQPAFTYFELNTFTLGWEIWRTDGTAAGTRPVTSTEIPGSSSPYGFVTLPSGIPSGDIRGTNGNDLLIGTAAADRMFGLDGDDTLRGGAGADALDGGAGFDLADYSDAAARVFLNLTAGVGRYDIAEGDTLTGIEGVIGSSFNDILTGDANANTLVGGLGDDAIYGLAGDDLLIGGLGADQMFGGDGIDTVSYAGNFGAVWIDLVSGRGQFNYAEGDMIGGVENVIGTDYADRLVGDAAVNRLDGGAGDDVLAGGSGADVLIGGAGIDIADYSGAAARVFVNLTAGVGRYGDAEGDTYVSIEGAIGTSFNDILTGDANANMLVGGLGDDAIYGLAGDDLLIGGLGADQMFGGDGIDTVSYAGNFGAVWIDLVSGRGQFNYAEGDMIGGVENVIGTDYADRLVGDAAVNRLDGGAGDDVLAGGSGADVLIGGAGIDIADYSGAAARVFVNLTAGVGRYGDAEGDSYVSIENATGTDFNDILTGDANANMLVGGLGDDAIYGLAGDDLLIGGLGADQMFGGDGIDTVSYAGNFGAVWIDLASGRGQFNYAEGDVIGGVENVIGTDYADRLVGDGAVNRLEGRAGNDVLVGGLGADVLDGGSDVDTADYSGNFGAIWIDMVSGRGQFNYAEGDTLIGIERVIGTDYDDRFDSNGVTNVFTGGAGNDLFTFQAGFGQDIITDFTGNGAAVGDTIRLGPGTFANFQDLMAKAVQQGADVVVTLDPANILSLQNVQLSTLHPTDFIFG